MDIFNIEPNVVSKNLKEKIVFIYGDPKVGKTTLAANFPKPLLIATEVGFNAIDGVKPVVPKNWGDIKTIIRQLKTDQGRETYDTVIIDTVDIAQDLCEEYICQRNGVEELADMEWGKGYQQFKKEFDSVLRSIPALGYGLVMISHSKDVELTDENGNAYNKIMPTLSNSSKTIVTRMADIYGYGRIIKSDEGEKRYLYLRGTSRFEAGSRFPYSSNFVELSYENLNNDIMEAIEKQRELDGTTLVEESDTNHYEKEELDFEVIRENAIDLVRNIMETVKGKFNEEQEEESAQAIEEVSEKITAIVDEHLGKEKKLSQATEEQAQMVEQIAFDLENLLNEIA